MASTSLTFARSRTRRAPADRARLNLGVEFAIVALLYLGYEQCRELVPVRPGAALAHGRMLSGLERSLDVNVEGLINRHLAHHNWLALAGGYYYAVLHGLVTAGVLIWLYARRPDIYRRWRRVLVLASVSALLVFWLFPVAPPRLAMSGIDDVLVSHDIFGVAHAERSGGFVNVYAAMPSLHVGWAVWAAAAVRDGLSGRRWRNLVWFYPIATTLVVLGTGNHYLLDAFAGAALVALALAVVRGVEHIGALRWPKVTRPEPARR